MLCQNCGNQIKDGKKILLGILLGTVGTIVIIIVLAVIIGYVYKSRVQSNIDYKQVYHDVLEKKYSENAESDYSNILEGTLYDIDKDGILELIILFGTGHADMVYEIYSTDGISAIKLGEIGGGSTGLYAYTENGFYTDQGHMGYRRVTFVSIQDGNLVEKVIYNGDEIEYDEPAGMLDTQLVTISLYPETYSTECFCIAQFDLSDGVLTIATDGVKDSDWGACEEDGFILSLPVAEYCLWQRCSVVGGELDRGYEVVVEDIISERERYRGFTVNEADLSSPLGLCIEVAGGVVIRIYTVWS